MKKTTTVRETAATPYTPGVTGTTSTSKHLQMPYAGDVLCSVPASAKKRLQLRLYCLSEVIRFLVWHACEERNSPACSQTTVVLAARRRRPCGSVAEIRKSLTQRVKQFQSLFELPGFFSFRRSLVEPGQPAGLQLKGYSDCSLQRGAVSAGSQFSLI